MAQTSDQASDSFVQGIEQKAGRPIEELVTEVAGRAGEARRAAEEGEGGLRPRAWARQPARPPRARADGAEPRARRPARRHLRRFQGARLEVGVNLRGAAGTVRFEALGPGKMCTHRTFVTGPEEIDDELLAFVRAACDAAG